jgi:hypothetical protein
MFFAHPKGAHIFLLQIFKLFSNKATAREKVTLGFTYLMPGCWREVSLHPKGPAIGQLEQGFTWFSSVLEDMLIR